LSLRDLVKEAVGLPLLSEDVVGFTLIPMDW
jgi:hypothetical protein